MANLAAVAIGDGSPASKRATEKLVEALTAISDAQKSLFASNPELEFHFDPGREPTAFMREIERLGREADSALAKGDRQLAQRKLTEALALEPPPLAYEVIEKRLRALSA